MQETYEQYQDRIDILGELTKDIYKNLIPDDDN